MLCVMHIQGCTSQSKHEPLGEGAHLISGSSIAIWMRWYCELMYVEQRWESGLS